MTAPPQPVVETLGLVQDFGRTRAPCRPYPRVAGGEFHDFLGPHSAGKSTTLRILLGLIGPAAGTARLFGLGSWTDPVGPLRDVAVLRLTVVRGRAGSGHGSVR